MGSDCLVTVLMACRRPHPIFLREALESIRWQSCPGWKALIIGDEGDAAALDCISEVLAVFGDTRFRLLRQTGTGLTRALNTGMRNAETPYACNLLADDLLSGNAVEVLEAAIRCFPAVDFFHSSRQVIDETGRPVSSIYRAPESFTLEDFKRHGPVKHLHCWKIASALAIGGMDENLGPHGADDYDFSWCMAEAGYQFRAIEECLYFYRDHRDGYRLTTHVPVDQQIGELRKICSKHGLTPKETEERIGRAASGYLRQALYRDAADRSRKEREGYDIRSGWRFPWK